MLSPILKSQAVYDTLYSFTDTTTFYNTTIIVVDDITNLAVKFGMDSTWESYQIEEVICSVPTGIDTTGWNYFFFSLGELPEDSLIYTKQVFNNSLSFFPEITSIRLDTPLVINNHSSFFVSGGFFNILSISQLFAEGIPNQFAFWYTPRVWVEYVPYYFNLKVVIKKNLTEVDDAKIQPTEFILEQNFPNPFNSQSIIIYNSPEMGEAKLNIYDVLGNKIYSDLNNSVSIGQNQFAVNSKNIVSGVYFYSVIVNNKYSSTKKMILLK
jgi:hypothetical protein